MTEQNRSTNLLNGVPLATTRAYSFTTLVTHHSPSYLCQVLIPNEAVYWIFTNPCPESQATLIITDCNRSYCAVSIGTMTSQVTAGINPGDGHNNRSQAEVTL